jgi:hypothetical protein
MFLAFLVLFCGFVKWKKIGPNLQNSSIVVLWLAAEKCFGSTGDDHDESRNGKTDALGFHRVQSDFICWDLKTRLSVLILSS